MEKSKKVCVVAQRAHHRPAQTIETHFVQQQHGLAGGKTHGCTDGLVAAAGLQVRHVGGDLLVALLLQDLKDVAGQVDAGVVPVAEQAAGR